MAVDTLAERSRDDVAQKPPADDLDLSGFPEGGQPGPAMFR
ncbi:MAG: hypothetical protein JWP75_918, partial [Frondihabitans sp.]|nr:hypothetical protein [Frondihabitans sp.]